MIMNNEHAALPGAIFKGASLCRNDSDLEVQLYPPSAE